MRAICRRIPTQSASRAGNARGARAIFPTPATTSHSSVLSQQGKRMRQESEVAIKVWDLPVRLFHWALVLLFAFQVVSGKIGGDLMPWHAYSGYGVLVLVVFRILWGFAGSTHARFASFLAGPAATLRFAKRLFSREAVPQVGHNPLGGWMVLALVVSLALQAATGLFTNDGVSVEGPLAALVSLDVSNDLSQLHRWNLRVLLVLAGLHVAAVIFHLLVKRENLTGAMFTGVKRVPEAVVHERRDALRDSPPRRVASRENAHAHFASPWRALALLAVALVLVYLVVQRPF
jgi:cytochrome b